MTSGRMPEITIIRPESTEYRAEASHTNFRALSMRMAFLSLMFKGFGFIRTDYTQTNKKGQKVFITSCPYKFLNADLQF